MSGSGSFIQRFGKPGGRPVVYLHGAPGAPAEAAIIGSAAVDAGVELWAVARAQVAPDRQGEAYLVCLAELIRDLGAGDRLPLLAFSIGAAIALRVAARLGEEAGPLFLVSAAGPLDVPDVFEGMGAGARVFRSAQTDGLGFALTIRMQTLMSRHLPGLLRSLLFAGTDSCDRAFAATPEGRKLLGCVYAQAWAHGGASYRRDLLAYVESWSPELARVRAPVELWHGRADQWAPVGMAGSLAGALPSARLNLCDAGHYTTLLAAAPAAMSACVAATPMANAFIR